MRTRLASCYLAMLIAPTLAGLMLAGLFLVLSTGAAYAAGEVCFATLDGGGPVYSSADAQAVRDALGVAAPGSIVKVAGYCAGVVTDGGSTQVALITQTITLTGGYTTANWTTYDPLANPTTLDALGGGRVIYASVDATLQGFTATNGLAGTNGGGIYAAGAMTLTDMTVYSNTAADYGGGLYAANTLILTGTQFISNTADKRGGGLHANSTAALTNTTFISNTATAWDSGGAYLGGAATLNGGTFERNAAPSTFFGYGGGVYAANTLDLAGTQFLTNTAGLGGGGLYAPSANPVTLANAAFISNTAAGYRGGGAYLGGAATLSGGVFERNATLKTTGADGNGGGVYAASTLALTGTQFLTNTAGYRGGGLYAANTLILTGTQFISNTADKSGGGLYAESTAALTNTTFISNTATAWDSGGAYLGGAATLNGGTFERNAAPSTFFGYGGGVYAANTLDLAGTQFLTNTAGLGGGGLYAPSANPVTLANAAFISNTAAGYRGGGAYLGGAATLSGGVFERNAALKTTGADGNGGGVYAASTLALTGTQFLTNTAGYRGGGAFVYLDAVVTNTTFVSNTATASQGGGAYFYGVTTVSGGAFERNAAADSGGGFYTDGWLDLAGTQFLSNTAGLGGGLYANNTTVITHTTFTSNTAGSFGGAIYKAASGPARLSNSTLAENAVWDGSGGGIYNAGSALEVTDSTLEGNATHRTPGGGPGRGGGIYNAGYLDVTNSTLSENSADIQGGGIYDAAALTVTNSTLAGNSAGTGGGGIYKLGASGPARLSNSTLSENAVWDGTGGGIYNAGYLDVTDSTLEGNFTHRTPGGGPGNGGGIYNAGYLDVTNSTLAENSADNLGGGIYDAAALTVTNSTLAANSAGTGGGVYKLGGTGPTLLSNTIIANSTNGNCSGSALTDGGYNLVWGDSSCPGTNADPKLAALADNGGTTWTMALEPDSAAIDAGGPATCAAAAVNNLDQRGQARDDLQCDIGAFELKYADSHSVIRPASSTIITTFGPALMGLVYDGSYADPGVITVTKSGWRMKGPESLDATWAITPTTNSGISLTLQLCFTPAELGSLNESDLRFWRYNGGTWTQIGGEPSLSTVNGLRCATLSGIDELSTWTLATASPTALRVMALAASSPAASWVVGVSGLLALVSVGAILFHKRRSGSLPPGRRRPAPG